MSRSYSVTPNRRAYNEAGAPYGRNRKALKRWLRDVKSGDSQSVFIAQAGAYAYAQIPVMLACNNESGNFDGNIRMFELHDALTLESCFVFEDGDFDGVRCELGRDQGSPAIICAGQKYHYLRRLEWCGNMCWDLFVMYGKDCLALLNYIQRSKQLDVTTGESRLFNHYRAGRSFGAKELVLIHKFSLDFRL